MSRVEIRDHALWIKHIHKNDALKSKLMSLEAGDLVELRVDGFHGMWKKMDDGKDGRPTPGIRAIGKARDHWHEAQARRGELLSIEFVGFAKPEPHWMQNEQNAELFAEWSESIVDPETRSAFWYLIGLAACLRQFECRIQWKGEIRDFRFYDGGGEQPFSFITNKKWLLFYFRPPSQRKGKYSAAEIAQRFESFNENTAGEWTVKINTIQDVDALASYLDWQ